MYNYFKLTRYAGLFLLPLAVSVLRGAQQSQGIEMFAIPDGRVRVKTPFLSKPLVCKNYFSQDFTVGDFVNQLSAQYDPEALEVHVYLTDPALLEKEKYFPREGEEAMDQLLYPLLFKCKKKILMLVYVPTREFIKRLVASANYPNAWGEKDELNRLERWVSEDEGGLKGVTKWIAQAKEEVTME